MTRADLKFCVLLSGGTITAITGAPSGSGYSGTATVTISGAGQQAFADATIAGGQIATVTIVSGGWGYITGTSTTVTATGSGGGSNAVLTATVDNSLTTRPGREVYQFSTANILAQSQALSSWYPVGRGSFLGGLRLGGQCGDEADIR